MLTLTEEQWAGLCSLPSFKLFLDQLRAEHHAVAGYLVYGAGLNMDNPTGSAMEQARKCGYAEALREIYEYAPPRGGDNE